MKTQLTCLLIGLSLCASLHQAAAQGTAFTYQGRLNNGSNPANGTYDLTFSLYNAGNAGTQIGSTVTDMAVGVTNGLFTATVDFGSGVFTGSPYWLQIGVRTNGSGTFNALTPRQQLTPTPYATFAEGANAAGLSGAIPAGGLSGNYAGAIGLTNAGNNFAGNGSGLSNLNASQLGGLTVANFWQSTGNAGTSPGINYLGTSDNEPLILRANNQVGLQLQYSSVSSGFPIGSQFGINIIGGYWNNTISSGVVGGTIAGGGDEFKTGATIFSNPNTVTGSYGTVGGGEDNTAGNYATVPGGVENTASGVGAFVGGGGFDGTTTSGNTASGNASVVAGGLDNQATELYATVPGGVNNTAVGGSATVSGGSDNVASGGNATVGGGAFNQASGPGAFVGGGGYDGNVSGNTASGAASVVAGGFGNQATNIYATVPGGAHNTAGGNYATVGGGNGNTATGGSATVSGGSDNVVSGPNATVSGGAFNTASGEYSFAAGQQAQALHQGAFVWADSQNAPVASTANDQFLIRAQGGVGIGTANPGGALEISSSGGFSSPQLELEQQANDYARLRFAPSSYSPWDIAVKTVMNFYVNGTTVMTLATNGNLAVGSISITGGSDLAEPFSFSASDKEISQGSVVIIDEANPGQLKLTDQPYDTHVAGVVSGANGIHPGIQMHQEGVLEGGKNVALSGRVYVQADTSNGAIKPGDLLTTSSTPGHAMKVSDHSRAAGAILGKAMTGLSEGKGMVLVLVTLQ